MNSDEYTNNTNKTLIDDDMFLFMLVISLPALRHFLVVISVAAIVSTA